jgi:hypothetical protein
MDMAPFHGSLFWFVQLIISDFHLFFGLDITEETSFIEMHICFIQIGNVEVLHL